MALALHRKYRPKKLAELLGHEENVRILRNAAKENRLGQAYLFYGSRGTGKTTTARLVAKLLNCEKRAADPNFAKTGEPCGECSSCLEIDNGTAIDLIEIDAASNRGIDEIRNLKENIRTAPAKGKFKVYIIDEAHMLTREASNALLKTLEEPPAHTVLILATTEYEKLPPTITSRTQRFLFRRLPKTKIMEKLSLIAEAENIVIDENAVELIAALGEGSFRDAESILDQLSVYKGIEKGKKSSSITLADVENLTGRVGFRKVDELAELILKKNLKDSLLHLGTLTEEGHDAVRFTKDLIHYLRKILTLRMNPDVEKYFSSELTADEIARVKKLSASADPSFLIPFLRSLIRAYSEMRYSPFAMIPLEITMVEHLK